MASSDGNKNLTAKPNGLGDEVATANQAITKLEDESVYYGTCSTAASTQQKAVTASNFPSALKAGQKLRVVFTNAQTYNGQPTLKVNSLEAVNICKFGTTAAARYEWQARQVLDFIYDGTNWIIVDGELASGNYPGKVKLTDNYSSTSPSAASTGVAASHKAVADAYTTLNGNKMNKAVTSATFTNFTCSHALKSKSCNYFAVGPLKFYEFLITASNTFARERVSITLPSEYSFGTLVNSHTQSNDNNSFTGFTRAFDCPLWLTSSTLYLDILKGGSHEGAYNPPALNIQVMTIN